MSTRSVWKVFYKDQLIGTGPSQAEALGSAFDYMRERRIKYEYPDLRAEVEIFDVEPTTT